MQSLSADLRVLLDLEDVFDDLDSKIRHAERKLSRLDAAARDALTALEALDAQIAASRAEEAQLLKRLKAYESQRDAALRAQAAGMGGDAVDRQLTNTASLIDEVETALLELLDARDALLAQRDDARRNQDDAASAAASAHVEHDARLAADRKARDAQRRRILDRVQVIHRDHRELDPARASRRQTSRLAGNTCSQCHRVIPLNFIADIEDDIPVRCEGCGRFVVPTQA